MNGTERIAAELMADYCNDLESSGCPADGACPFLHCNCSMITADDWLPRIQIYMRLETL